MVHIASEEFYQRVSDELRRCKYVLTEGVSWRKDRRRQRLYDLAARNLGLAAQEDALHYPETAERIHIDMPRPEFRRRFSRIPLRYRLLLIFLRPLLWVLTKLPELRNMLLTHMVVKDSQSYRKKSSTPLKKLILDERDRAIVANMEEFYERSGSHDETTYAAIVFGAGHMNAISHCLRELGFRPGTRKWLETVRMAKGAHGDLSPT
jgi:hypothetical protein